MVIKMVTEIENDSDMLDNFLERFKDIVKRPTEFLSEDSKRDDQIKCLIKDIYDFSTKKDQIDPVSDVLQELVIEDMDEEQIWQQLELKTEYSLPILMQKLDEAVAVMNGTITESNDQIQNEEDKSDDENSQKDYFENESDDDKIFSENDELNDESFEDEDERSSNNVDDDNEIVDEENELDEQNDKNEYAKEHQGKPSIVDDKFFKLSEMAAFLNQEDKKEMSKNSKKKITGEEIDYFSANVGESDNDDDDDDEEENINYKDFFEPEVIDDRKKGIEINAEESSEADEDEDDDEVSEKEELEKSNGEIIGPDNESSSSDEEDDDENPDLKRNDKRKKPDLDSEDESELEENESENEVDKEGNESEDNLPKSSFELRQKRLNERIGELEDRALGEKPWQLKGEVTGTTRPNNSLLQEILEYDSTTKPAPVITEEVNKTIEDIILQRIKDKAWDDVERKIKSISTPQELRKKLILNQEKSKESLAQIYEKEYQSEIQKLTPSNNDEIQVEPKEHTEIKAMMTNLFRKLDALSNFHFTPKPIAPEPKIITNTPVINMEEVAPLLMSDAKQLAPEEIKNRLKGDFIGKSERSKTDKNRERRHKKLRQKAIFKAKEEKSIALKQKGIPLTQKDEKLKSFKSVIKNRNVSKASEDVNMKNMKSSKAFFNQLQDKTTTKDFKRKPTKTDKDNLSAKKLKL